jgi:uncharacterized protein YndB with AHSA1/START domain
MGVAVDHRSFVIERTLPGSPGHAYRFWSDHALKRRWTSCHPDWHVLEDRLDFAVDGSECLRWRMPDGTEQSMLGALPGDQAKGAHRLRLHHAIWRTEHILVAGHR